MSTMLQVAADEWRYWRRRRLLLWTVAPFFLLLLVTGSLTTWHAQQNAHDREHAQEAAEARFTNQPDRHPHRMVHYGHYVFRTPAPLAVIDPGLDAVTGQAVFLEGHRQNSATFADVGASANLGTLVWLSPAVVYQLFGPLVVIVLGFASVVREREASTLPTLLLSGVRGSQLVFGKLLALAAALALLILPLLVAGAVAEGLLSGLALGVTYFVYLLVWAAAVVLLSAVLRKSTAVLTAATAGWLGACLLVPSVAVDNVARSVSLPGTIETKLAVQAAVREQGDGHNESDPAFAQLRAGLLDQYNVENIEDLPVNFRGVVAVYAEGKLTDTLNAFAERRMDQEMKQRNVLSRYGWVSPMLAVANASRALAGTSLAEHHRFLQQAEAIRFDFVQTLNEIQAQQTNYRDDVIRSKDAGAEKRARVSAANWHMLDEFRFQPAGIFVRSAQATSSLLMLGGWLIASLCGLLWAGRRLAP